MVQPPFLLRTGSAIITEFASWKDSIVSAEARVAILNSHLVMWKITERRGSKLKSIQHMHARRRFFLGFSSGAFTAIPAV